MTRAFLYAPERRECIAAGTPEAVDAAKRLLGEGEIHIVHDAYRFPHFIESLPSALKFRMVM